LSMAIATTPKLAETALRQNTALCFPAAHCLLVGAAGQTNRRSTPC
jgi:hypothetical protein